MSEASVEILRMVADNVISVEEAERLLHAIEGSAQKGSESARRAPGGRPFGAVAASFDSLVGALSGLGPMVRDVVEEAVNGIGVELDDDEEPGDSADVEQGRFAVPAGSELVIRSGHAASGELRIEGIEGDTCELVQDPPGSVHVSRGRARTSIRWANGPLTVRVPSTVARVKAKMLHGNVSADALDCELAVQAMGGELALTRVKHPFDAKTMGGSIRLSFASSFNGEGKASAMGANIDVELPEGLRGRIRATTFGGKIEVEPGVGRVERGGSAGKDKVVLTFGDGPKGGEESREGSPYRSSAAPTTEQGREATLALKTMGGQVHIRRAAHD